MQQKTGTLKQIDAVSEVKKTKQKLQEMEIDHYETVRRLKEKEIILQNLKIK